jgi:hypothetical protein
MTTAELVADVAAQAYQLVMAIDAYELDTAGLLDTPEARARFLEAARRSDDPAEIAHALELVRLVELASWAPTDRASPHRHS